jgi:hypothetical protein
MTAFLMRHPRLRNLAHRMAHARTPNDQPCRMCKSAWRYLQTDVEFVRAMDQGLADVAAGRVSLFRQMQIGTSSVTSDVHIDEIVS